MFSFDNLPDHYYNQRPGVGKCARNGGLETARCRHDGQFGRCAAYSVGGNHWSGSDGRGDRRGTHQTQSAGNYFRQQSGRFGDDCRSHVGRT